MKRFILTIFLVIFATTLFAQNATLDRLKSRLHAATSDLAKVEILDSLSMYNMFFYHGVDSTLSYCHQYIDKAVQLQDKKYLILAYARLSFFYNNITRYKETLSTALKALNLSEQYHNQDYLAAIYYDLAWAYSNLNDSKEALKNGLLGISYLKQNKDPFFDQGLHLYGITGSVYQDIGKADSAEYYYKKMDLALSTSRERSAKAIDDWYWVYYNLFYAKQYEKADSFAADGIKECLATGNFMLDFFYCWSAYSAIKQKKIDRAIQQAKLGFNFSLVISDPAGESYAANLLEACYEKKNNRDSAFNYLKLEDSLVQVIQNNSNALDIQQFQFDQQLNKKEQVAADQIQEQKQRNKVLVYVFLTGLGFLLVILYIQWRNSNHRRKANETLQLEKEKVERTLMELKSAQTQLIQREKMASLGELTAGIAHEIQNPLNFVNNFSEVNQELMVELNEELAKGDIDEAKAIATDVIDNLDKISRHGKRADSIVKGMLEHSKQSTGAKDFVDINQLAEEYLRLAYNGFLAKDKMFNIELITHFDVADGPKLFVSGQDIGRVLLNLYNNAFYAVHQRSKTSDADYKPIVEISTFEKNKNIIIEVKDNGIGIPDAIKDKIMQPFFTTKPTGEGTGLGLSLSYDIVVAGHSGTIEMESQVGQGSVFRVAFPEYKT